MVARKVDKALVGCSDPRFRWPLIRDDMRDSGNTVLAGLSSTVELVLSDIPLSVNISMPGGAGGNAGLVALLKDEFEVSKERAREVERKIRVLFVEQHIRLHQPREVELCAHEDCGAEGSEDELRLLAELLKKRNPDIIFTMSLFVQVDGHWEKQIIK